MTYTIQWGHGNDIVWKLNVWIGCSGNSWEKEHEETQWTWVIKQISCLLTPTLQVKATWWKHLGIRQTIKVVVWMQFRQERSFVDLVVHQPSPCKLILSFQSKLSVMWSAELIYKLAAGPELCLYRAHQGHVYLRKHNTPQTSVISLQKWAPSKRKWYLMDV